MSKKSQALAWEYINLGGKGSPENFEIYFEFDSNLKTIFHDVLYEN